MFTKVNPSDVDLVRKVVSGTLLSDGILRMLIGNVNPPPTKAMIQKAAISLKEKGYKFEEVYVQRQNSEKFVLVRLTVYHNSVCIMDGQCFHKSWYITPDQFISQATKSFSHREKIVELQTAIMKSLYGGYVDAYTEEVDVPFAPVDSEFRLRVSDITSIAGSEMDVDAFDIEGKYFTYEVNNYQEYNSEEDNSSFIIPWYATYGLSKLGIPNIISLGMDYLVSESDTYIDINELGWDVVTQSGELPETNSKFFVLSTKENNGDAIELKPLFMAMNSRRHEYLIHVYDREKFWTLYELILLDYQFGV